MANEINANNRTGGELPLVLGTETGELQVPDISLGDYLLDKLRARLHLSAKRPYIMDVSANTCVYFGQVEDYSLRIASALTRRGFKKGDVLFYASFEMAQLAMFKLAVWRLGGTVRGGVFQCDVDQYVYQMREVNCHFAVMDADLAPRVHAAVKHLDWDVQKFSVGLSPVEGTESFDTLIKDDGTAMPAHVEISPREDVVAIPNTSGSTGTPKGVLQTHYSTIATLMINENCLPRDSSLMEVLATYGIGTLCVMLHGMCFNLTIYHFGKFQREQYFDLVFKHKPREILIYPFVATWFARCEKELQRLKKEDFLKHILIAGWVLDPTTAALLSKNFPEASIMQMYAMTESWFITNTGRTGAGNAPMAITKCAGEVNVSSGKLLPHIQLKVVDLDSRKPLARNKLGEILIKSPSLMKGYLKAGSSIEKPDRSDFESDGFMRTGDIGFVDEDGEVYVRERVNFMFKYCAHHVSPCEVENVLAEHPAVLECGVVGTPNMATHAVATAVVVVKPGFEANDTLAADIVKHVASRMLESKQLHGGVRFVKSLPTNAGGKLDRRTLLAQVLAMDGIKK